MEMVYEYQLGTGEGTRKEFFGCVTAYGWEGPITYTPQGMFRAIVKSEKPMTERLRSGMEILILGEGRV